MFQVLIQLACLNRRNDLRMIQAQPLFIATSCLVLQSWGNRPGDLKPLFSERFFIRYYKSRVKVKSYQLVFCYQLPSIASCPLLRIIW